MCREFDNAGGVLTAASVSAIFLAVAQMLRLRLESLNLWRGCGGSRTGSTGGMRIAWLFRCFEHTLELKQSNKVDFNPKSVLVLAFGDGNMDRFPLHISQLVPSWCCLGRVFGRLSPPRFGAIGDDTIEEIGTYVSCTLYRSVFCSPAALKLHFNFALV